MVSLGVDQKEVLKKIYPLVIDNSIKLEITANQIRDIECMRKSNYSYFYDDWNAALKATGLEHKHITPHSFRRTYITKAWEVSDHNLEFTMNQAGHKRADTLLLYLRRTGLDRKNRDLLMQKEIEKTL